MVCTYTRRSTVLMRSCEDLRVARIHRHRHLGEDRAVIDLRGGHVEGAPGDLYAVGRRARHAPRTSRRTRGGATGGCSAPRSPSTRRRAPARAPFRTRPWRPARCGGGGAPRAPRRCSRQAVDAISRNERGRGTWPRHRAAAMTTRAGQSRSASTSCTGNPASSIASHTVPLPDASTPIRTAPNLVRPPRTCPDGSSNAARSPSGGRPPLAPLARRAAQCRCDDSFHASGRRWSTFCASGRLARTCGGRQVISSIES